MTTATATTNRFPAGPRGAPLIGNMRDFMRDPRYFDDPETFTPSRWDGDLAKRLPKFAYFPFGGGPRLCIGHAFAMMEAVLLLATIAQRVHFTLVPGQTIVPMASITLRPKNGVQVIVNKR